jgi:hypothetical protein
MWMQMRMQMWMWMQMQMSDVRCSEAVEICSTSTVHMKNLYHAPTVPMHSVCTCRCSETDSQAAYSIWAFSSRAASSSACSLESLPEAVT